jgi:hypothetical protein
MNKVSGSCEMPITTDVFGFGFAGGVVVVVADDEVGGVFLQAAQGWTQAAAATAKRIGRTYPALSSTTTGR